MVGGGGGCRSTPVRHPPGQLFIPGAAGPLNITADVVGTEAVPRRWGSKSRFAMMPVPRPATLLFWPTSHRQGEGGPARTPSEVSMEDSLDDVSVGSSSWGDGGPRFAAGALTSPTQQNQPLPATAGERRGGDHALSSNGRRLWHLSEYIEEDQNAGGSPRGSSWLPRLKPRLRGDRGRWRYEIGAIPGSERWAGAGSSACVALSGRASAACWSPDDRFLAVSEQRTGAGDHSPKKETLLLIRAEDGAIVWEGRASKSGGDRLIWSPSGNRLGVVACQGQPTGDSTSRRLTVWNLDAAVSLHESFQCPLLAGASVQFSQQSDWVLVGPTAPSDRDGRQTYQVYMPDSSQQQQLYAGCAHWGWGHTVVALSRRLIAPCDGVNSSFEAQELSLHKLPSPPNDPIGKGGLVPPAAPTSQSLWISEDYSRMALAGETPGERQPWVAWLRTQEPLPESQLPLHRFLRLDGVGAGVGPARGLAAWAPRGANEHLLAVVTSRSNAVVAIDTQAGRSEVLTAVSSPLVRLSWAPCGQYVLVSDANMTAYNGRGQDRPTLRLQAFAVGRPPDQRGSNVGKSVLRPLNQARTLPVGSRVREACEARAVSGVGTPGTLEHDLSLASWFLPRGTESFDFTPVSWSAGPPFSEGGND